MEVKRTATALVLFLCTAFLLWWVAASYDLPSKALESTTADSSYMVVIHHSIRDDAHVYTGTVVSSGCQSLSAGVQTEGVDPVLLSVQLKRIASTSCSARMGEQVSEEPFSISINSGSVAPRIKRLTLDGAPTTFTVLED